MAIGGAGKNIRITDNLINGRNALDSPIESGGNLKIV
jgi:hypothetical protein